MKTLSVSSQSDLLFLYLVHASTYATKLCGEAVPMQVIVAPKLAFSFLVPMIASKLMISVKDSAQNKTKEVSWRICLLIALLFSCAELTLIHKRPARENVTERQGQTAGIVRLYCRHPERHVLKSPQLPFGLRPFNMEFSIFEWLEGKVASAIDGPVCDSVELVARVVAIFSSAMALLLVFQIGNYLIGPMAGLLSCFCLATDWLWIKLSSFTMIDNRMVACGFLAIYLTLSQKRLVGRLLAALFWFLTISQKPQAFAFIGPFYVTLDAVFYFLRKEDRFFSAKRLNGYAALFVGLLAAAIYFICSDGLNVANDLPWLTWTGPKIMKWMLGDWAERLHSAYYKSQFLEWIRKTGILMTLPAFIYLAVRRVPFKKLVVTVFMLSLAFFVGRLLHTFVFLNVFKVHDYYAVPQNAFAALTRGLIFGVVIQYFYNNKLLIPSMAKHRIAMVAVLAPLFVALVVPAVDSWSRFHEYSANLENPQWAQYESEWGLQIFPKKPAFVVVAHPGRGRDYLYLYFTKQEGHIWCSSNKEFAPRAFWKAEGVEYVAWADGKDPQTGRIRWIVRTMEEELAFAREKNWSSDVNDVWAAHSMDQWAAIASRQFKDPCEGNPRDFDPRNW